MAKRIKISEESEDARALDVKENKHTPSIQLYERVKRLYAANVLREDIAKLTGRSINSINRICRYLGKITLDSPDIRKVAVKAATKILESDDNPNIIKIIDKVFPTSEQKQSSGVSVNLNFNPKELDFANPDHEFVDVEGH